MPVEYPDSDASSLYRLDFSESSLYESDISYGHGKPLDSEVTSVWSDTRSNFSDTSSVDSLDSHLIIHIGKELGLKDIGKAALKIGKAAFKAIKVIAKTIEKVFEKWDTFQLENAVVKGDAQEIASRMAQMRQNYGDSYVTKIMTENRKYAGGTTLLEYAGSVLANYEARGNLEKIQKWQNVVRTIKRVLPMAPGEEEGAVAREVGHAHAEAPRYLPPGEAPPAHPAPPPRVGLAPAAAHPAPPPRALAGMGDLRAAIGAGDTGRVGDMLAHNPALLFEAREEPLLDKVLESPNQNRDLFRLLVRSGVPIPVVSPDNPHEQPFLHKAVEKGQRDIVEDLLIYGRMDPNLQTQEHATPMHEAVLLEGDQAKEMIDLLVRFGGVNAPNRVGKTPVQIAEELGKPELARHIQERISQNRSFDLYRFPGSHNKLMQLTEGRLGGSIEDRCEKIRELTAYFGPGILNQSDRDGYPPLAEACFRGESDIANLLIDLGANPTQFPGLLEDAVLRGDVETVRVLLVEGGLDPNIINLKGETPLHAAAKIEGENGEQITRLLLEFGAVSVANKEGKRPDAEFPIDASVSKLSDKRQARLALNQAIVNGNAEEIRNICRDHPGIVNEPIGGVYPAAIAINLGDAGNEALQVLLDLGASPKVFSEGPETTILHQAVQLSNAEAARIIVSKFQGTGVNFADQNGQTPLHLAWGAGKYETFGGILYQNGRGMFAAGQPDKFGHPPVKLATIPLSNPEQEPWVKGQADLKPEDARILEELHTLDVDFEALDNLYGSEGAGINALLEAFDELDAEFAELKSEDEGLDAMLRELDELDAGLKSEDKGVDAMLGELDELDAEFAELKSEDKEVNAILGELDELDAELAEFKSADEVSTETSTIKEEDFWSIFPEKVEITRAKGKERVGGMKPTERAGRADSAFPEDTNLPQFMQVHYKRAAGEEDRIPLEKNQFQRFSAINNQLDYACNDKQPLSIPINYVRLGKRFVGQENHKGLMFSTDIITKSDNLAFHVPGRSDSVPKGGQKDIGANKEFQNALKKYFESSFEGPMAITAGLPGHAICLAINPDGTFKVIDSMNPNEGFKEKHLKVITDALNAAEYVDKDGQKIVFRGSYHGQNLQRGGSTACKRFTELNAYIIAKTGEIDSYQRVTGAFLDGKLTKFNDIDSEELLTSRKVETAPSEEDPNVKPFLHAFAHRQLGLPVDDWKQMTLSQVKTGIANNTDKRGQKLRERGLVGLGPNGQALTIKVLGMSSDPNKNLNLSDLRNKGYNIREVSDLSNKIGSHLRRDQSLVYEDSTGKFYLVKAPLDEMMDMAASKKGRRR